MGRSRRGRDVDGILVLDKPAGPTSNQALQAVKRLFAAAKAGHTGSLDPMATGVLPICLGEATKFTRFLLEADKVYAATFRLGISTTTGDAQGELVAEREAAHLDIDAVEVAAARFRGKIAQVPPMYSALKRDGRPLYELARQGIEVERVAREVQIHEFSIVAFHPGVHPEVEVSIHCSKGTYVRVLAEDLGKALGCGAHVTRLRRLASGPFEAAQAVSLEKIATLREAAPPAALDALLLPADAAVADRRRLELTDNLSWYFVRGQPVVLSPALREAVGPGEVVRVFRSPDHFLGIGQGLGDGRVKPHRLVRDAEQRVIPAIA